MFVELQLAALVLYGVTAFLVVIPLFGIKTARGLGGWTLPTSVLAVAFHFTALILLWQAMGNIPMSNTGGALSSLAFMIGFLAVAVQSMTRDPAIQIVASPMALVTLGFAVMAGFGVTDRTLTNRGAVFIFHTSGSLLGLAFLAVAFAAAALYLVLHRELKGKSFGAIYSFLPSLDQLDRLNRVALALGFPVLTAGIVLGVAFARISGPGSTEPTDVRHIVWGTIAWAALGVVSFGRMKGWINGRRAAHASAICFVLILIVYLMIVGTG